MDRSPGASTVAAQGRIAAGIGGVVLVHAGEEAVKIIKLITRSEVISSVAVGGVDPLLQTACVLGAPVKFGPQNTELRMLISEFNFNGISAHNLLLRTFLLRDVNGKGFSHLPIMFVAPDFAAKVKTNGGQGKLLVVHTSRKQAKKIIFPMKKWGTEGFYQTAADAISQNCLQDSGVNTVVVDYSVLMESGQLLAKIRQLNINLVVTIPCFLDAADMQRAIDSGAVILVMEPFHKSHSAFVSSIM